jgi:hypothetical protein
LSSSYVPPAPTASPTPITSGYATTPSGAVVNVATGQLVSPPPSAPPAASNAASSAPPAPTVSASGLIQSTNPNLKMYSFKPLANGNVEIYENGTPISAGGGFSVSYAQSLGYSPLLSQPTPAPTVAAVNGFGNLTTAPIYTFSPTAYGTVQVFQNGQLVSTTTPQYATQQYGYQPSSTSAPAMASSGSGGTPPGLPNTGFDPGSSSVAPKPPAQLYSAFPQAGTSGIAGSTPMMISPSSPPTAPVKSTVLSNSVSVVSVSSSPMSATGTQPGTSLGTMQLSVPGRGTITLTSNSNGNYQGTTSGSFQCVALINNYARQLGLSAAATGYLGNGSDTAQKLSSLSGGQFSYFGGSSASMPPTVGSVISIAGYPKDPYGHVGIAQKVTPIGPNQYQVTLFDQNWPYYSSQPWKVVTFTNVGNVWVGTMPDSAAPNQMAQVSGWANPAF